VIGSAKTVDEVMAMIANAVRLTIRGRRLKKGGMFWRELLVYELLTVWRNVECLLDSSRAATNLTGFLRVSVSLWFMFLDEIINHRDTEARSKSA
jgi:hypothetical protein